MTEDTAPHSAPASPPDVSSAPQVLTTRLEKDAVLLDLGSKQYFQLNESAAVAWDQLSAGASVDDTVQALMQTFAVGQEDARAAVETLVATLRTHGLLPSA